MRSSFRSAVILPLRPYARRLRVSKRCRCRHLKLLHYFTLRVASISRSARADTPSHTLDWSLIEFLIDWFLIESRVDYPNVPRIPCREPRDVNSRGCISRTKVLRTRALHAEYRMLPQSQRSVWFIAVSRWPKIRHSFTNYYEGKSLGIHSCTAFVTFESDLFTVILRAILKGKKKVKWGSI